MMNVLTKHSTCRVAFSLTGLVISFLLALLRQLEDLSWLSSVSFISIVGILFTCMIGVSSTNITLNHNHLFPQSTPGHEAFLAITNVVFAYAGHAAFFTFFSALKDLRDYPK
jgi:uncharacterized protein YacL